MNALNEDRFEDLCRDARVAAQMTGIEDRRRAAARTFWIWLGLSLVAAFAIVAGSIVIGWDTTGVIVAIVVATIGLVAGRIPLSRVGHAIKLPVLERLAQMIGASFTERGFEPPAYAEARPILFGRVSESAFENLFQSTDSTGRHSAFYEARLKRGAGRGTTLLFTGQVYAFQRARRGAGDFAILTANGLPDLFNAPSGMERVPFESDAEFDSAFHVYALRPGDAQSFLGQSVRRALVDLRRVGRVSVHVGSKDIFVAVVGKDRFEPGSLFSPISGRERVRIMFDDVRTTAATLDRLVDTFG